MPESSATADLFASPPARTSGELTLRDYQVECLETIQAAHARGVRRQLVTMATGLGKSVIFRAVPKILRLGRVLCLVHLRTLIDQAARHFYSVAGWKSVGIEQADRSTPPETPIVVGSVQTLGQLGRCWCRRGDQPAVADCPDCRGSGRMLRRLRKWQPTDFDAVIVDEAHHVHAHAEQYMRVLKYLKAGQPGGPVLFGFTATPERGDGFPLANVFDEHVYNKDLLWGIEHEWLVPIRAGYVRTDTDLTTLKKASGTGDFSLERLAETINTDPRNSKILSGIARYCRREDGAPRGWVLIFGANRNHVLTLTAQLLKVGHTAEYVLGDTPTIDRQRAERRFHNGDSRFLVNCGVYTEGWDQPRIESIVMARPTLSPLLYAQMLGRGTRPSPETGKTDLLVLDIVDNTGRNHVKTASTAFGMRAIDCLGQDIRAVRQLAQSAASTGIQPMDGETAAALKRRLSLVDVRVKGTVRVQTRLEAREIFGAMATPVHIERTAQFPWVELRATDYVLELNRETTFRLSCDTLGQWQGRLRLDGAWTGHTEAFGVADAPPFALADAFVKTWAPPYVRPDGRQQPGWYALSLRAPWRRQDASDGQRGMLGRLGFDPGTLPDDLSKGAASQMIGQLMARRRYDK